MKKKIVIFDFLERDLYNKNMSTQQKYTLLVGVADQLQTVKTTTRKSVKNDIDSFASEIFSEFPQIDVIVAIWNTTVIPFHKVTSDHVVLNEDAIFNPSFIEDKVMYLENLKSVKEEI